MTEQTATTEVSANHAQLEELYSKTLKEFTEGTIISGTITDIRGNDVLVDIGYKSEGSIPVSEFRNKEEIELGNIVEVLLENLEDDNGNVILSKQKAEVQRNWNKVVDSCNEGDTIEGEIRNRVRGGMLVDVMGIDAFLPGSQVDIVTPKDPDALIGQTMEFRVLKINEDRRNIVVSRRELLEEERRAQKQALMAEIAQGQSRIGIVKNITDFGAFIDLNGLDGLLHITDMTWGRINHPSEMLSVGQEIEVLILDIDYEKERVSLGLKQKSQDPWDGIEAKYPIGSEVTGKVVNLMPYGAFIELENGVEGLVHVSELSWTKRYTRASDALNQGEEVNVIVKSINQDDKKVSLSLRDTEKNPWEELADKYAIGSRLTGKVRHFTNFGAFVELENGVDGMIHLSDMSWTKKVTKPTDVLQKGDEVEAILLEIDPPNQRISLGLKQAQDDPWDEIVSKYSIGQKVTGTVSKTTNFGAFVSLEEDIEGLVHISQISEDRIEKVTEKIKVGDEIEARIIKVDNVDRRIGLSIRAATIEDEEFEVSEDMLEGLKSGEDIVDLGTAFDEAFGDSGEWSPGDAR